MLREARDQRATPEDYASARAAPLGVSKKTGTGTTPYPAFQLVHRQLRRDYDEADLRTEGLRIFTSLDPRVQEAAETALAKRLSQFDKEKRFGQPGLEGAVVVSDPQSGEVQALVGGRDPRYRGYNRALDAARPVGSLLQARDLPHRAFRSRALYALANRRQRVRVEEPRRARLAAGELR